MTDKDRSGNELCDYFDAARAQAPAPSGALMRRVGLDGARAQQRAAARPFRERARQLVAALGGWGGLSGLAAASATGIWLGYAPPAGWPDLVNMLVRTNADLVLIESDELAFVLSAEEG